MPATVRVVSLQVNGEYVAAIKALKTQARPYRREASGGAKDEQRLHTVRETGWPLTE